MTKSRLSRFFEDRAVVVRSDCATNGKTGTSPLYILIFPDGYIRTEYESMYGGRPRRNWQSGEIGIRWDVFNNHTLNNTYNAPTKFQGLASFDPVYFSALGRDNFRIVGIEEALKIPWINKWLERGIRAFEREERARETEERNERIRIREEALENERKAKQFQEYLRRRDEEIELEPYQNAYYIIVVILIIIIGIFVGC